MNASLRAPAGLLTGTFACVTLFYCVTLCPTVYWDDSGELITAAYVAGIPHPPGEPLYVMLGWIFTHLPGFPSPAYAMNVMSAVFGGVTWMCIAGWIYEVQRARGVAQSLAAGIAVLTAAIGAAGQITWAQSVVAENTTLHTAFIAVLLWSAWRLATGPRLEDRVLFKAMLVWSFGYGLSASNHPAGVFLFPAFAAWFIATQGVRMLRPHWITAMLLAASCGLLPYAYLVFASQANPPLDWGNPENLRNFLWVVTAKQYETTAFRGPEFQDLVLGGRGLFDAFRSEWGVLGSLVALGGWLVLFRRDRSLALWPLPVLLVFTYLSANPAYIGAYLVPAFLFSMPAISEGIGFAVERLQERVKPSVVMAVACVVPAGAVAAHWEMNNLSDDDLAHRYGMHVLESLPDGAVLVTDTGNMYFITMYLQHCEGVRTDVTLFTAHGLHRPGYQESLQQIYPWIVWPEHFSSVPELADAVPRFSPQDHGTIAPWVKDYLFALYDTNGETARLFFETADDFDPILSQFANAGYAQELRRPLSEGRRAAWAGLPRLAPTVPEAWDVRVEDRQSAVLSYTSALARAGTVFLGNGHVAEAMAAYERAVVLRPEESSWGTRLASLYLDYGQEHRGEEMLIAIANSRRDTGMYAMNVAGHYEQTGRYEDGLSWSRRALDEWTDPPVSALLLGARLEAMRGDVGRAFTLAAEAEGLAPDDPTPLQTTLQIALQHAQWQHARRLAERAFAVAPDSPVTHVLAARLAVEAPSIAIDHPQAHLRAAMAADAALTRQLVAMQPGLTGVLADLDASGLEATGARSDESRQTGSHL